MVPPPPSRLTALLRCRLPLIQAPMAGGVTTPSLVAAVCNAGGVGFLGAAYLTPQQLRQAIHDTRAKTSQAFGVNLFIPEPFHLDPQKLLVSVSAMNPAARELGVPSSDLVIDDVTKATIPFDAQAEVVVEERVPFFSCTFGLPSPQWVERFKAAGVVAIGTATTVAEAEACVEAGMEAVVVQGGEAGGHRGTFLPTPGDTMISTMALVPQVVEKVGSRVPVIAAGGIMDGRGIMAALSLGAEGVQMGTAFLTTHESGASPSYKKFLLSTEGRGRPTTITKSFSGRPARGVLNRFIQDLSQVEDQLPDFPLQNLMTRPVRQAASTAHNPEFQSLWAGQGFALARELGAGELVKRLEEEMVEATRRMMKP